MNEYSYYAELRKIRREAYQEHLQLDLEDKVAETIAKASNDRNIRNLQQLALENPSQFAEIMKLDQDLLGAENIGFQREMLRDRKINKGGEIIPDEEPLYNQPQIGSSDIIDVSDFFNV